MQSASADNVSLPRYGRRVRKGSLARLPFLFTVTSGATTVGLRDTIQAVFTEGAALTFVSQYLAITLVLLVSACSSPSSGTAGDTGRSAPDAPSDAGVKRVDGSAVEDVALVQCRPSEPDSCAYIPTETYEIGDQLFRDVTYTDVTGADRLVRFAIRRPANAPTPSPLIIWSHGGSGGRNNPAMVGVDWSEVFVGAGYVTLAIAHSERGVDSTRALCEALDLGDCDPVQCMRDEDCRWGDGADAEAGTCAPDDTGEGYCRFFKQVNWDRPHDVAAIIDWVEAEVAGGTLEGQVDPTRIAHAGHSAGAGAAMMLAGASRRFRSSADDVTLIDPRPIAFISASPQGPDADGFTEASFSRERCMELAPSEQHEHCLTRPHLMLTGLGDGGEPRGENRRLSFDLSPAGDRYLGYITEAAAQHTIFNFETDGCVRHAEQEGLGSAFPERCFEYRRWLRSAALAFLDAHLRERSVARAYLQSDNLGVLGGDAFEWVTK